MLLIQMKASSFKSRLNGNDMNDQEESGTPYLITSLPFPLHSCYFERDKTNVKRYLQIVFDCRNEIESERRRNGIWFENICTVYGGIKHRCCFLLTRHLHDLAYIRESWCSRQISPQSLDIQGRKSPRWWNDEATKTEVFEELMLAHFSLQHRQFSLSTKDLPPEDVLIFVRNLIDRLGDWFS